MPRHADTGLRPAPLGPLLVFVWLNSLAGGAVGIGVFFVTDAAHRFSRAENFALGVAMGFAYILGALAVGPALRRLTARLPWLSSRGALAILMALMSAPCAIAWATAAPWSIWLFAITYQPLAGALWPITESYVSGGRRAHALRRAIGAFNYTWSSAIAVAFWAMAPLRDASPLAVFLGVAIIHLLSAGLTRIFPPEPARHLDEAAAPHPESYERLLPVFRWLLATSYLVMYALGPALPSRAESDLRIAIHWATPVVSAWLVSRVLMFLLMERWHGWHGRWRTPIWTTAAMFVGFGLALLAPSVPLFVLGLAVFGIGVGGIYCGALYYAMEVGAAQVEAGGAHEATIGAGMTLGPALGLASAGLVAGGLLPESRGNEGLLGLVGACSIIGVLLAARSARRRPATGAAAGLPAT